MDILNKNPFKSSKDYILVGLIVVSIALILYSGFYLLNYYSHNNLLCYYPDNLKADNKTKLEPNEIGDSIGGILNPIIGFTAAIITFLAFYIQYRANIVQKENFQTEFNFEKKKNQDEQKKEKELEQKNHFTNVKVFKVLINDMLSFYNGTGDYMKKYIEKEKNAPLNPNIFNYAPNASYYYFSLLNFTDIYTSIVFYFRDKNIEWETDFIQVLNSINFYDKYIQETRLKYQEHVQKKTHSLSNIGEALNEILNEILKDNNLNNLASMKYYSERISPSNKNNKSTDFENLRSMVLTPFIKEIIPLTNNYTNQKYTKILETISKINKTLGNEKFQSENYCKDLEEYYNQYFTPENKYFKDINDFISKINIIDV